MKYRGPGAAGCLAVVLGLAWAGTAATAENEAVTIRFVGEPAGSAWQGAQQALGEINLQGRFAGFEFELRPTTVAELSGGGSASLVLAAAPAATLDALGEKLPQVLVFNLVAEDDALRAQCRPGLFSTIPSAAMKRDAMRQWRAANSQGDAQAFGWNHNFRRYSARDLNRRFADAFGRPMDDVAWAGWAAVRIAGDAVMRTASTDPETLRVFLQDGLSFDGSKGFPLTFRATGQLRQPIWIVRDGQVIAEAPIAGVADPDDLDSLGRADCPGSTER